MPENLNEIGWATLEIGVPPELVEIGVVPDLQRFFDAMVYKLRRNAHKGRWETLPFEKAMEDLWGEIKELQEAALHGSTTEILLEAADVANEALIVANIALESKRAREKSSPPASPTSPRAPSGPTQPPPITTQSSGCVKSFGTRSSEPSEWAQKYPTPGPYDSPPPFKFRRDPATGCKDPIYGDWSINA